MGRKNFLISAALMYAWGVFLLLSVMQPVHALAFQFQRITALDGLSQNTINHITLDSTGYLWFASDEGLNRYDGYKFTHFRQNTNQKNGLFSSKVQTLLPDNGYLWIGTLRGLNLLNTQNNQFVKLYPLIEPLKNANVISIAKTANGLLWIGTTQGLIKAEINPHTGLISQTRLYLNALSINALTVSADNNLWIGTDSGLFYYNNEQAFFSAIELKNTHDEIASNIPANISSLFLDDENILWVGTDEHGIFYKALEAQTWQSLNKDSHVKNSLSSNSVSSIYRDRNQVVWIGFKQDGIDLFNLKTQTIEHITQYSAQNNSLSSDNITHIFQDKSGIIWIATQGAGVNKWNPVGRLFNYTMFDLNNTFADSTPILNITPLQSIYIVTQKSIYKLTNINDDISYQQVELILESPYPIADVVYDENKRLFWLVNQNELIKFNLTSESAEVFSLQADHVDLLEYPSQLVLKDDLLIIGTESGNLYQFNTQNEQLKPLHLSTPINSRITKLLIDSHFTLWIATDNGVWQSDLNGAVLHRFTASSTPSISNEHIISMHEFPAGTIWLGTLGGGLNKITQLNNHYLSESYNIASGLPTNTIQSIQHDNNDFLWLSSNNGLSRFNPILNQFKNFDQADGLQSTLFSSNASFYQPNEWMYFANNNGFTRFKPEEVPLNDYIPPIVLTNVKLDNLTVEPKRLVENVYKIDVPYQVQFITIQLASLDFANVNNNRFAYKQLGMNTDWVMLDNQHVINFNKLSAGNYKLRIRGTNSDGVWNQSGVLLYMEIASPPWFSQWAIAIYCLVIILFIAWLIHIKNEQYLERENALAALHQSEERLKLALWGSGDQLWDWDLRNYDHTKTIEDLFKERVKRIHPDDQERTLAAFEQHYTHRSDYYESTYRIQNAIGKNYTWVLDRGKIFNYNKQGRPTRFAGTFKNIQTIKETEEKLRLIAQAFEHTSDGAWIIDTQFKIVAVNHAYKRLTGYHPNEVIGSQLQLLSQPEQDVILWEAILTALSANHQWEGEINSLRKNGDIYPCAVNISVVKDNNRNVTHYVGLFSDITYKKQAEKKLIQLANYDVLTSLPNRIHFNERLQLALNMAKKHNERIAVFFLDLDHFKHINDTLGHATGDLLLKEVAKRLQASLREEDTVARLGGDEFTIILENIQSISNITTVADSILKQMAIPIHIEGNQLNIGTSIGISIYPEDGQDADMLLQNADTAMYHAKKLGRNNFQFFTEEMNNIVQERVFLESHLRHAIRLNELNTFFQPKYDILQQRIIGAEVLIRWQHSDLGLIPPSKFIPIAEESNLIIELGEWIIQQTCMRIKQLLALNITDVHLALNLSARQFNNPKLLDSINHYVHLYQIPPQLLEIEITEGTIMDNLEHTIAVLDKLRKQGFKIAIDDFGTGYSSLSYLKKFPVHTLKIDQSFIKDITDLEEDASIVDSIITLAHNLHLNVIAEGVETIEQFQLLKQLGCDQCQGYLVAKPLPFEHLSTLVQQPVIF